MRLHSFQIQNFKSIIYTGNCKISDIDNIVVLAGQNESGKSSILEALDFFANGPSEKFEKFEKRQGTNITEVKCDFLISTDDLNYLKKEFNNIEYIQKFFEKKKEITLIRKYEAGQDQGVSIDQDFFEDFPEIDRSVKENIEIVDSHDVTANTNTTQKGISENEIKTNSKIINELSKKILNLLPVFSLYGSFDDLLPSEIAVSDLKNNKAVQDFETVFETKLIDIANISDTRDREMAIRELQKKATDDFNDHWSQSIKSLKENTKYSFTIKVDNSEPLKIEFMIEGEDGIPQFLEQRSKGFRWFSAFHLRLRALMKKAELDKKDKDYNNIIILIDEPGQNLHDTAQKDVKNILNKTAIKQIQIIYSTHNPNLIGDLNTNEVEYTRMRITKNHTEQGTKVYNISQFIAQKDGGSIDALSPIRAAMGLNSMGSILDNTKFNVIVEGITDYYYLTAAREFFNKDSRLRFIPVCGVNNVKSMVGLLIGWGMDYKAVFDDDPKQGGRKVYNDLKKYYFEGNEDVAKQHILKINGCNGIEDIFSKDYFRKFVYEADINEEEKMKSNAELVKISGKELVARRFLEKVRKKPTDIKLDNESKKKIEEIFKWLYEKFDIN